MCDVHHWPFIDNTPINLLHPQQLLLTVLISSIRYERDRDTTRLRKGREDGGHTCMTEGEKKKKLMYMYACAYDDSYTCTTLYICTCTCRYTKTCTHMYTCIYMYTYTYVYMQCIYCISYTHMYALYAYDVHMHINMTQTWGSSSSAISSSNLCLSVLVMANTPPASPDT